MIFLKFSIKNTCLIKRKRYLSINFCMYFHIVGIKEVQNKKYNMDIVLQGLSESFIRDFLHTHNIVLLEISEYKNSPDSFGKLELIVQYKQNEIHIVSYLTDIEIAAYNFMMI